VVDNNSITALREKPLFSVRILAKVLLFAGFHSLMPGFSRAWKPLGCKPLWVCAILGEAKGHGFTANPRSTISSPVFLLPQWFTGFHRVTEVSLPVIPRR
jgi:hypothetical protein